MKKILYMAAALSIGVSCWADDTSLESPAVSSPEKRAHKTPALEKQSFKDAVNVLCTSPQKVDLGDKEKGSAYLKKHLSNVEVKMEFHTFALISEKDRHHRLAKLASRAGISDCELEKKWKPALPKEEPPIKLPFEDVYLGTHTLRVNRINDSNTKGEAEITREGDTLILNAKIRKGSYHLDLKGKVIPRSEKEFIVDGRLRGNPDLSWMNVVREQDTRGRFLFKATKKRKYWRLYRVDGARCACGDSCGNDFCYIDISFEK